LRIAAVQAADEYREASKAVAEACGLHPSTVSRYIKARSGENYDREKDRVEQLSLVFEEVGAL